MALENSGTHLLSGQGVSDIYDMFIATQAEMASVGDEISTYVPLFDCLKKKQLIKKVGDISPYIAVPLMDKANPTVQWVSGYDSADRRPTGVLSEGRAEYGHLHGSLVTNREEQVKNRGKYQQIDLIDKKRKALRIGLGQKLETALLGTQEADGKMITGLGRIMDESATLHNLAPASYPFWVPTRVYKTGTTAFALATEYRLGMRKLFRDTTVAAVNISPNLVLCGEDVYDAAWAYAESKLAPSKVSELNKMADPAIGGDTSFEVMGRMYLYVPTMDAKTTWATNWQEGLELRAHRGTYFLQGEWMRDPAKVQTIYSDNMTYLSLFCTNRKAQGKIVFS